MVKRFLYFGTQAALFLGFVQVTLAFLVSVLNWGNWMPIIVSPFLVAIVSNRHFYQKNEHRLPTVCVATGVVLFIASTVQFVGIVTNPFFMPMTPASLAIPIFMIALALIGLGLGYSATTKRENA